MTPDDRRYTREHEWILPMENGNLRIGITDFAQDALGDVVFVALPEVGASVREGDACGEVESTKSVSEIYAPVAGTIVARNDAVETAPETLNTDPYEGGWLFVLEPEDPQSAESLLAAEDYDALVREN
ncbi:MAG: glycine cleavage system protein GcvH [Actinobacteria bacterium]|jgi:glycine cleavage system H protein|nr:glycine cleavage system protein GcvH [Micrococcales bacterium]MCB0903743.1 glycine cleavage system protein GcvH [Actinomycetota bacterium]MCO5299725.1 glycine cleavage system protein GcvH [Candidatus Nanopelagicales bacterium]MCB9428426.1 glycine cleavage system protein GcvH [Actinomycetota bacterium]HPE13867.1 glycine cleavage system protein GcvH [Actinomycetota bacterium]